MARTSSPHIGRIDENRFEHNEKKKHIFRSGQARRIVEFVNVDKVEFVILYLFALPFWSRCLSTLLTEKVYKTLIYESGATTASTLIIKQESTITMICCWKKGED